MILMFKESCNLTGPEAHPTTPNGLFIYLFIHLFIHLFFVGGWLTFYFKKPKNVNNNAAYTSVNKLIVGKGGHTPLF